ncbi:MAG: hypothetical protein RLZZ40_127 [Actinomycetota bacterium]
MIPPISVREVGYTAAALTTRVDDIDTAIRECVGVTATTSSWATDGPPRIVLDGRIRVFVADLARVRRALESVISTIRPAERERAHSLADAAAPLAQYVMSDWVQLSAAAMSGNLWAAMRPLMSAVIERVPHSTETPAPVTVTPLQSYATSAPDSLESRVQRIPNGDVHIRIERYGDGGGNRFEVYLSGTNFFGDDSEPWNFGSNIDLARTGDSSSLEAVRFAMQAAGITRDTPVVFTGHSQGGLIALALAESGDFDVEAIFTVGTPVGAVPDTSTIPTVHLVHPEDPVPAAGGFINPTSSTWIVPTPHGETLIDAHHRESYVPGMAAIDALHDRRIEELLERIQPRGVGVRRDFVAVANPANRN